MNVRSVALVVGTALLAACAAQTPDAPVASPSVPAAAPIAAPIATQIPTGSSAPSPAASRAKSTTVADAIPAAQLPARIASLKDELQRRIGAPASAPAGTQGGAAYRLQTSADGLPRLVLDADRAFETGTGQLRPELLVPLAEAQAAMRGGSWVVHVVGQHVNSPSTGEAARSLAERRAAAVAAVLTRRGQPGARLRAEARAVPASSSQLVEVIFRPIVEGREAEAWLSP